MASIIPVEIEPSPEPRPDRSGRESPERSASAEPLLTSEQGNEQRPPESDSIRMDIENRIRDVLNTRPSVRMASRHKLSPLHINATGLDGTFDRSSTSRHTMPSRSPKVSAKSLPQSTVRRRQLRKTSFLSSFSLGEGLPLQRRLVADEESNIAQPETTPADEENGDVPVMSIVVQDIEQEGMVSPGEVTEDDDIGVVDTLERGNELRKSTLHLKHRILKQ